jgi:hypothetical protein
VILRSVVAAASVLIAAPVATPDPLPLVIISPQAIVQVLCFGKNEITAGTAFRIGRLFLSVNHVTSSGNCFIDGKPIKITWQSPTTDFSMLAADPGPYIAVDCNGFVRGKKYLAIGYARGLPQTTLVELVGTGEVKHGQALLAGMFTVVPGQSGGPIIDEETGKAVGTVNAENFEEGYSISVELKSTPVCRSLTAKATLG